MAPPNFSDHCQKSKNTDDGNLKTSIDTVDNDLLAPGFNDDRYVIGIAGDQVPSCHKLSIDDQGKSKSISAPVIHRRKTFLSIFILACAWMSNDLVLAWVHERVPYQSDPLPDIWFSAFPEYQPAIKLTEALLIVSLLCSVAVMIFHRQRWLVTRRVFFISALCYLGRAFCITLTQVPVPSRRTYCAPPANETSAALLLKRAGETLSGMGMDTLLRPRELCGDLIYSGHTTILCLCFLTVSRYAPREIRWLRYFSLAMTIGGVVGILIARKHYTLDVVLAYYITTRVYWIYHTLADNKSAFTGKRSMDKGDVANVFWSPMIKFLESDAQQMPILNQFDAPFPSTREFLMKVIRKIADKRPRMAQMAFSFWPNKNEKSRKSAPFLSV